MEVTIMNDYIRRWRHKNRKHVLTYSRNYYKTHADHYIRLASEWRKRNPYRWLLAQKATVCNRRYVGRFTMRDIEEILKRGDRTCFHCGKRPLEGRDLTIEHLRPVNDKRYVVVSCFSCNAARIPDCGPRKSGEQKCQENIDRVRRWVATHRQERRDYQRIYMRK